MNHSITYSMYYVAIVCPPDLDEKVLQFKDWMKEQFGCIVALKSPAHITLIPPFWMNESKETELLQTLQSFKNDLDNIKISLEGFSHFGNRVLFINVKDNPLLNELRSKAEDHFIRSFSDEIKRDGRSFHPHITIATRDIKHGDFETAWKYFYNKDFKETFLAENISLLRLKRSETYWQVIQTAIL